MTEIITEKWEVSGHAKKNGTRRNVSETVFAKGRGEARVTAIRCFEDKGYKGIILSHSEQLAA